MPNFPNLFFTYSQIYQLSYALPLYQALGGTFLVKNMRKWIQFKKYMRGLGRADLARNFFNTPAVKKKNPYEDPELRGLLVTPSVERFCPDNSRMVYIYTGHGSGDKPYFGERIYDKMASFDYHFLAGPKNLQKLRDKNVDIPKVRLIKIGNMRFDAYVNGHINRATECARLGIRNPERKNILYAPTWKWGQGSLGKHTHRFCEEINPHHNLIIRPHGHDRMRIPRLRRWIDQKGFKHVYFSNPSHLARDDTMLDFAVSDILISDRTSSIVYEYLITGKPIIVIGSDFEAVHHMPEHLLIDGVAEAWDISAAIVPLIEHSFRIHEKKRPEYERLLKSCFYFNDGKSTQRAVAFIERTLKELA
jgi:hypothetical protein